MARRVSRAAARQAERSRAAGWLVVLGGIAALAVAYWAQDVRGLVPCPLCLIERWPYRIVILLGVLAALSPRRWARAMLVLAVVALLAGMGAAFLHVGVEQGWWPSPLPECNGMLTPGAALPTTPAIPCDRPVYIIPHLPISMAMMDLIYAMVFALALIGYLLRKQRRFR